MKLACFAKVMLFGSVLMLPLGGGCGGGEGGEGVESEEGLSGAQQKDYDKYTTGGGKSTDGDKKAEDGKDESGK